MKKTIGIDSIAPCGMNCAVCRARLREKNTCGGCHTITEGRQKTLVNCKLRTCTKRTGGYCFDCEEFPCARLKQLDKRYRTKYGMSEIENLIFIRDSGIEKFVEKENKRWVTEEGIYCVHDKNRYPLDLHIDKKNEQIDSG